MIDRIESLAEGSRSKAEAIARFCRDVLSPELDATLGAPFVLLVSGSEGTEGIGNVVDLPDRAAAYSWIQTLAYLRPSSDPLILRPGFLPEGQPEAQDDKEVQLFERFSEAAFIPLGRIDEVKLALGVLQRDRALPFVEDAEQLVKALGSFIQPVLVGPL